MLQSDFNMLRNFFKQVEQDLQYPNCEGQADKARILEHKLNELNKLAHFVQRDQSGDRQ